MEKKAALVLGGTEPHIVLIENLKQRGFYVILLDYLEAPPAKEYADEHVRESTLELERVLEVAKEKNVRLVISACIDQANHTACYVAEQLNLPRPYSSELAQVVTNKKFMKETMKKHHIPTSDFLIVPTGEEFRPGHLKMPLVVKPVDCNGSKGVRKIVQSADLEHCLNVAQELSRTGTAIVEEYVEGMEISVDCFVRDGVVHIPLIREKQKAIMDDSVELHFLGSIIPAQITEAARQNIFHIASQIASAFILNNTPFLLQAIVNGDRVNVIEFAPRMGGGLGCRMQKEMTGYDGIDAVIDSFLGIPINPVYEKPKAFCASYHIFARPGIFDRVEGEAEAIAKGVIEEFVYYRESGTRIKEDRSSRNRIGGFITKAASRSELVQKVNQALELLEVYDTNNNSIMIKDKYR